MKQSVLQEKYPVFTLELCKDETGFSSVGEILADLKSKIEAHEAARFIAIFDHYAHTRALEDGCIGEGILDAKNIVFCFGIALPDPAVMAVRPRSIGVSELQDKFIVNFMEAPMPVANTAMENWAKSLRNLNELEETGT